MTPDGFTATEGESMRKNRLAMLVLAVLTVLTVFPVAANAAPPSGDDYPVFICPATNHHNPNGTWVLGAHGAYYVNIVVRGQETDPAPGIQNKVFVKVDEDSRAVAKAQIPAGFGLYKDVFPDAFNADGSASATDGYDTETAGNTNPAVGGGTVQFVVLLGEGIDNYIAPNTGSDVSGWEEFQPATVVDNGDGTYTVTNLPLGEMVTIDSPIPLAAGVFW
jgi:hypothetical protein